MSKTKAPVAGGSDRLSGRNLWSFSLGGIGRDAMCQLFRTLAGSGVEYILIDDDFRLSYHGREFFCF